MAKPLKILTCCSLGYYSNSKGNSYEYLSFVEVPRRMGHAVHHYDYVQAAAEGKEAMNDCFLSAVKDGGYDLVLVVTYKDEFLPGVLDEARRHAVTLAWNCDDDCRWEDYSSKWVGHYTWMATTYRHIYEAHRAKHSNLLLSQWGCTGLDEGFGIPKDLDISFVGLCYGTRIAQVQCLRREVGLQAYGKGVPPATTLKNWLRQRIGWRLYGTWWTGEDLELPDQAAVKAVWNRSRIAFTPLDASRGGTVQIKARVFDMGLSGTAMLCSKNPSLHEFYQPGEEFVEFESMDECVDKARYLLTHESERAAIARRYYQRTKAEHLWEHRFEKLFREMGLS